MLTAHLLKAHGNAGKAFSANMQVLGILLGKVASFIFILVPWQNFPFIFSRF